MVRERILQFLGRIPRQCAVASGRGGVNPGLGRIIPNIKKAKQVVFDREILSRLTPHNIHFSASYAEQGNCYRKTLMIKNFPKDIPPAALMELAKQRGTTFTMRYLHTGS